MFFIGQDHIMYQLGDVLTYTYREKIGGALLFRGASGYGKTELAKRCCNFLVGKNYQYCLGNKFVFDPTIWVHFIDEIHLMEEPEMLYSILDGDRYVFVFATNFDSLLPEALSNRCKSFIFSEYTDEELIEIFNSHASMQFRESIIRHIIEVSGRNPRIMIKTFLSNLEMHFAGKKEDLITKSDEELIYTIDTIHGIKEGLDKSARQYLEALRELGGRASVDLLSIASKMDKNTMKYTIEPGLIYKKLIKITSRGRELC